mmetsp:Transcript_7396/g.33407  ORF Transcript_7396/g.33407 Transcript_7396/m.33407 type:complete len:100 (+) Transcript_7396:172-471(+)
MAVQSVLFDLTGPYFRTNPRVIQLRSSPPIDAVLARVGTCDSMETDASTFAVECRECARILERATVRSLVLVDELGRSTASAEGERFAWSVAEALMKRG